MGNQSSQCRSRRNALLLDGDRGLVEASNSSTCKIVIADLVNILYSLFAIPCAIGEHSDLVRDRWIGDEKVCQ